MNLDGIGSLNCSGNVWGKEKLLLNARGGADAPLGLRVGFVWLWQGCCFAVS